MPESAGAGEAGRGFGVTANECWKRRENAYSQRASGSQAAEGVAVVSSASMASAIRPRASAAGEDGLCWITGM